MIDKLLTRSLSDDQREALAREGFTIIESLFSRTEVEETCRALTGLLRRAEGARVRGVADDCVHYEPGFDPETADLGRRELGVRKFFRFQRDPFFARQVRHPGLLAALDGVLGPGARLLQAMAMVKPPGIGSPKDWHQDTPYFPLDRSDQCLGFWIALDEATRDNGCMEFSPGSHRQGPLPHVSGPTGWRLDERSSQECASRSVAVPLPAGWAVAFDANCCHFTGPNRSERRRRAVQYHYVSRATRSISPKVPLEEL